ncbi:TPA: sporulation transcription factor Spo0A [Candidatus Ventrenecus stercoripullorum]|nr:sporulation transcription factor Spo0A [Candidatus Ventrenecus stercoripullorum]
MKTKINALVVDDSMEFTSSVKEYFKNNAVIKIVDVVTDGEKAVDYIKEHQDNIDVILMDLIIPGKDGLQILEELEELKIKKHLIILSSYRKDYTIRMTSRFNVDYYMLKPINLSSLENRIKEVMEENKNELYVEKQVNPKIQLQVTELLHNLGVPSQIKGYQYLREGILMLYESTGLIGGITKEVYPEIALRYNTTPSRVERAIRHAIEVSWNRADYEMMNKIFGHSIDYDRAKPTNSEFMVTLSDALRLNQVAFN